MDYADQQERLYAVIEESTEEIDYVIDSRLQPGLFAERSRERAGFGAAVASADLEAEAAEVGQWVANYHRQPTDPGVRSCSISTSSRTTSSRRIACVVGWWHLG